MMAMIVQNAAVAAVPIDDGEIARRQRAHHRAGEVAQQSSEALDRQA